MTGRKQDTTARANCQSGIRVIRKRVSTKGTKAEELVAIPGSKLSKQLNDHEIAMTSHFIQELPLKSVAEDTRRAARNTVETLTAPSFPSTEYKSQSICGSHQPASVGNSFTSNNQLAYYGLTDPATFSQDSMVSDDLELPGSKNTMNIHSEHRISNLSPYYHSQVPQEDMWPSNIAELASYTNMEAAKMAIRAPEYGEYDDTDRLAYHSKRLQAGCYEVNGGEESFDTE